MEDNKNYFADLNTVNVGDHTEKKNGLTYLSWAWAWGSLKTMHPDANYTVYERQDGRIYWDDGKTCWVKVGVTVKGIEHIEYLPVMNNRNQSIPLAQVTSMDINKSIQRCLTKAIARHGLGLYIYAGEDMPEDASEETPAAARVQDALKPMNQNVQYNPYAEQKPAAPMNTTNTRIVNPITPKTPLPSDHAGRSIEQIYSEEGRDGIADAYKGTQDINVRDAITAFMNEKKKETVA